MSASVRLAAIGFMVPDVSALTMSCRRERSELLAARRSSDSRLMTTGAGCLEDALAARAQGGGLIGGALIAAVRSITPTSHRKGYRHNDDGKPDENGTPYVGR